MQNQDEKVWEFLSLTPPPLGNVGLCSTRTMTKIRNRRFRKPKKLLVGAMDEELFVKRPQFGKKNLGEDQKIKQEDDKDEMTDNQEESNILSKAKSLNNFLKMDSSHRWIWYEFVDSLVDSPIMGGAGDLGSLISEYYPQLQTRILPRRAWQILRRRLGKSRRFSPAFVSVELKELERSRQCVRQLQQSAVVKSEDHSQLEQIYKRVPKMLAPNAKVSCYLQGRNNIGIREGTVISFNSDDSTYLVRFAFNNSTSVFCLPDVRIKSEEPFIGLPLFNIMAAVDSNKEMLMNETVPKVEYSRKLLESLVRAKKLLLIKKNAVLEISQKNEELDRSDDTASGSSQRRDAKTMSQRDSLRRSLRSIYMTLHRVNADLNDPMSVLHEHLVQYRAEAEKQEDSVLERFNKCCHQAELDIQNAVKNKSLELQTPSTRDLVQALQAILHVAGELGGPDSNEMYFMMNNMISNMTKSLIPALSSDFKHTMDDLADLRKQMADMFKIVPKEEPTEDITPSFPEQCMDDVFIQSLIAETESGAQSDYELEDELEYQS